MNVVIFILSI